MFIEERQNHIYDILKKHQRIEVTQLTEMLNISADTIRRDLKAMEKSGILKRTHGGAMLLSKTGFFADYEIRANTNHCIKEKIAEKALEFINENDTIFLQSSTTVALLASKLKLFRHLAIFTNSVIIAAQILSYSKTISVNIIGGAVSNTTKGIAGPSAVRQLDDISVDKVFLGACSISSQWGLSTPLDEEIDFNRKLIDTGQEIFILADSNKLETKSTFRISGLKPNFKIITDEIPVSDKFSGFERMIADGMKFISVDYQAQSD
ncbi:MAG: DeoR/GlpR transcriptional regulator [Spirochaetes bacterium]|nr:DeoR/GlpR transcriptional regulator [Spirochaetota bacterium]